MEKCQKCEMLQKILKNMYEKYENGRDCFDEPGANGSFIGQAIRLSLEEEQQIIEALK